MSDFEIENKEKNKSANDTDSLNKVNSNHSRSKKIAFNFDFIDIHSNNIH